MTDTAREIAKRLKPCPFCGGPGEQKWAGGGKAIAWIACQHCGAKGPWTRVGHGGCPFENWNKRAIAALSVEK